MMESVSPKMETLRMVSGSASCVTAPISWTASLRSKAVLMAAPSCPAPFQPEPPMNIEAPKKFRVVLVEDQPMFREQLAQLINKEPSMTVCGEADNIRDAFELLQSASADIVIVDLALKGPSGLELIKDLKARGIGVPVLVLSMHDELLYAERVLRAGARGYITKQEASHEVMAAIRKVLEGEVYLGSRIASRVLEGFWAGPKTDSVVVLLTNR